VVAAARPHQASCCLASVTDVADDADTDLVLHQLRCPLAGEIERANITWISFGMIIPTEQNLNWQTAS